MTIKLVQESGPDGILHLSVPVERPGQRYQVTVVVEPAPNPSADAWPTGFFENTHGAWKGELTRAPQGEPDVREEF